MRIEKTEMDQLLKRTNLSYGALARIVGIPDYTLKRYLFENARIKPDASLRIEITIKVIRKSLSTVPDGDELKNSYRIRSYRKGRYRAPSMANEVRGLYELELKEIVEREIYRRYRMAMKTIMEIVADSGGE